jgi:pimeloyl-ACP methyl ester carboxylesterase
MGVRGVPETEYARVEGDGRVAYQVVGDGPVDVLVTWAFSPVDMMWEEPRVVGFLDRLSSFCRHVWFDPRGTGASDRIAQAEGRLVESFVDDMVAVIDHLGCERVAVLGLSVPVGAVFAATHPDRTTALVLADASARYRSGDSYPGGRRTGRLMDASNRFARGGLIGSPEVMAPSLARDAAFRRWVQSSRPVELSPWVTACGGLKAL